MPFALRPGPAPAVTALVRQGIDFTLHPYDAEDIEDSLDLALLLDVAPERVLDTVVVDAGGRMVACVLPAGRDLDDGAAAAAMAPGGQVRPALEALAERATGQPAGAVSPLGHRRRLPVVLDRAVLSLRRPDRTATVYIGSGQIGLAVEVAVDDLVRAAHATVADLIGD